MSKLSKAIANAIIEFNAGLLTQDELYQKLEQDIDDVSVKVWREDKSIPLPTYGREGDACCDVYAKSIEYDSDKDRFIIHTGLHFALPDEYEMELRPQSMLKLNNVLSIETYGNNSKVVNPKIPYKVYQCNSLARMQDKNGSNTLHVVLEDITPDANNDVYNREKVVVELNQFMNTWNPYVEPKEEIKDEVGEVHD